MLSSKLKAALKEPLVHFIFLGALIFVGYEFVRSGDDHPSAEIVVSDARAASMFQTFIRTWQRPPTESELSRLIDDYIKTEIFVREALGLDRDDLIIRRRLRQKMEFFFDESVAVSDPTEQELSAFLAQHADQYRTDTRVTFSHIYLDPQRRGAATKADAERLLKELGTPDPTVDPLILGDPIMILKPRWEDATQSELVGVFGTTFTNALVQQASGQWVGPLASAYGEHLVKIDAFNQGIAPKLERVRSQVERDWRVRARQARQEATYQSLLKKYRVEHPQIGQP
jgi:hypothetical protein